MRTRPEDPVTSEDTSAAQRSVSEKGRRAFVDSAYGLSVHWGLYTLYATSEWVYYLDRIPWPTYRSRMAEFNPRRFDAEEWGDLMLEAGQKFLMITSKHHDGFCMWDTDTTDYKVTNTAFKRDPIAELAQALHDRGLKLHFYYSVLDWTRPEYRNDWPAYVAYYQAHLRELLTRYGQIAGVLFDGDWPRAEFEGEVEQAYFPPRGAWDLAGTYDLIHELQPDAVVVDNSHILPRPGEDYQVWELDLPGQNRTGFNTAQIGDKPKAVWWNVNSGWGYAPRTHALKPANEILATMADARRAGADVFILNAGPRRWGDIHPDEATVMREIGAARRRYGIV
jgi:alpha-L-fucosidase